MKSLARILTPIAVVVILSTSASAAGCDSKKQDIVDTALAAGSFNTLAAALTEAGLVDALRAEGPFTVFAPTDDAFAKSPAGTVESLLKPENRDQLIAILTYHVVDGRLDASSVIRANGATSLNGQQLNFAVEDGNVSIGNAQVTATDVEASNGIIHVIDSVLLPPEKHTSTSPTELIEMAIERGVPMYNHGNAAGCAAIYEMTANALMSLDSDISAEAKRALSHALGTMAKTHSADEQAWIMRRGLDKAYVAMHSEMSF